MFLQPVIGTKHNDGKFLIRFKNIRNVLRQTFQNNLHVNVKYTENYPEIQGENKTNMTIVNRDIYDILVCYSQLHSTLLIHYHLSTDHITHHHSLLSKLLEVYIYIIRNNQQRNWAMSYQCFHTISQFPSIKQFDTPGTL